MRKHTWIKTGKKVKKREKREKKERKKREWNDEQKETKEERGKKSKSKQLMMNKPAITDTSNKEIVSGEDADFDEYDDGVPGGDVAVLGGQLRVQPYRLQMAAAGEEQDGDALEHVKREAEVAGLSCVVAGVLEVDGRQHDDQHQKVRDRQHREHRRVLERVQTLQQRQREDDHQRRQPRDGVRPQPPHPRVAELSSQQRQHWRHQVSNNDHVSHNHSNGINNNHHLHLD